MDSESSKEHKKQIRETKKLAKKKAMKDAVTKINSKKYKLTYLDTNDNVINVLYCSNLDEIKNKLGISIASAHRCLLRGRGSRSNKHILVCENLEIA